MNALKKISNILLKRERILNLLKDSIKNKVTYISAPIGCGKTIAVKQLEEDMQCSFFWVECDTSKNITIPNNIINKYIVLENFNKINNTDKQYVLNFINTHSSNNFIIISRKPLEIEFKKLFYLGKIVCIETADLNFTKQEVNDFLMLNNIIVSSTDLNRIYEDISGYAIITNLLTNFLNSEKYNNKIYNTLKSYLFEYIEYNIFNNFEPYIMDFLLKLSCINIININSVNYILDIKNSEQMLNLIENSGSFLTVDNYSNYVLIDIVREYLNVKALTVIGSEGLKKLYLRAAKYYKDIEKNNTYASEYYILAKEYDIAASTLTKESIQHLGIINYKELEKYILKIPNSTIIKYPSLCISLAHIYILNNKLDTATNWYNKFKKLKENFKDKSEIYNNLNQMEIYYLICLPTTNDVKLMDYLKLLFKTVNGTSILNTITFTGNYPSILAGGKDLSQWGKHYKLTYATLNPIVKNLFKNNQYGSGEIAISELLYQYNNIEESIEFLTKGLSICNNIDNLFVDYSMLDKIGIVTNDKNDALDKFYKKLESEKSWYLMENYNARVIENDILYGNLKSINNWIINSKIDIVENFNALNRYQYFILVRAYISTTRYTEALIILERLNEYIEQYKKRIYKIEYYILKSICLYKQDNKIQSYQNIEKAIIIGKRFNYIRLFADEGSTVYEILYNYSNSNIKNYKIINTKYFNNILIESKIFGKMYPNKYKKDIIQTENLTKKESEILNLIEQGKSNNEICDELNISLSTVKTHINHIYSKLGTKNRIQTLNKIKKST